MQPSLGKRTEIACSHQKMLDALNDIKGYENASPPVLDLAAGENAAPQIMDL